LLWSPALRCRRLDASALIDFKMSWGPSSQLIVACFASTAVHTLVAPAQAASCRPPCRTGPLPLWSGAARVDGAWSCTAWPRRRTMTRERRAPVPSAACSHQAGDAACGPLVVGPIYNSIGCGVRVHTNASFLALCRIARVWFIRLSAGVPPVLQVSVHVPLSARALAHCGRVLPGYELFSAIGLAERGVAHGLEPSGLMT
jgi:hypothetical protein